MSLLVCFSGQIGSGKSSVSAAVAEALGWRRTGFGDYLRSEITRLGGNPDSREALQDLGQKRVDEDPKSFCRDVLIAGGFKPGDNFVVDGVRHVSIFDILVAECKPTHTRLLFLGAVETTRIGRVQTRDDAQDFARATTHRVEAELGDTLPQRADGVVNAEQPLDRVVSDCLKLITGWLESPLSTGV
jgi:cytidylate kinase